MMNMNTCLGACLHANLTHTFYDYPVMTHCLFHPTSIQRELRARLTLAARRTATLSAFPLAQLLRALLRGLRRGQPFACSCAHPQASLCVISACRAPHPSTRSLPPPSPSAARCSPVLLRLCSLAPSPAAMREPPRAPAPAWAGLWASLLAMPPTAALASLMPAEGPAVQLLQMLLRSGAARVVPVVRGGTVIALSKVSVPPLSFEPLHEHRQKHIH